jgi:hypothetical protein
VEQVILDVVLVDERPAEPARQRLGQHALAGGRVAFEGD